MSRPTHRLGLSTLLALLGCGVGCGVVYTGDQPLWYVGCTGTDQDCTCDTSTYSLTQTPGVKVCSAAEAGGLCCSSGGVACLCRAVRCISTGASCQCAFWPNATGDLTDCGPPPLGQSCCMDAKTAVCTCSAQACAAGTSPVPSCSPQYFTCDLLAGSEPGRAGGYTVPESACSDGPVDNFNPCSGANGCEQ